MSLIDKNREPTRFELRIFGLIVAAFCGLVGWLVQLRWGATTAAGLIWGSALALIAVYYAKPKSQRMIYFAWMAAFYPLGWLMSHVMLAAIYFLVLTPIGFAMRLFGRDPMERQWDPAAKSYWTARAAEHEVGRCFRQF